MASGKTSRSSGKRNAPSGRNAPGGRNGRNAPPNRRAQGRSPGGGARKAPTIRHRQVPWLLIGAITVIVVLVGGIGIFLLNQSSAVSEREGALAAFRPTAENKDPSLQIPGVVSQPYEGQHHVQEPTRVAYDKTPPYGGPHDQYWAACTGTVYPTPVRTENMVHSLEHGAVWITYDPARVSGPALDTLRAKVEGQQYMMISPFPGLDQPISLQSWGHQLKLADANDPRIDQFVAALKQNPNTYPEVGASCDALGPGAFDPDNPPPFAGQPYPPDAVGMDYQGTQGASG